MHIIEQGFSLSEDDLGLIASTPLIDQMLKQRLVVEFDVTPNIDEIDFSGCTGFYHVRTLGKKRYQFWFEKKIDYDCFRENMIAYKLSQTIIDK
jgi:hypothetical protein|tara:strand:- start:1741 stop:2022 length:282 start_codon:yes stop_codon:yes gene_type:complete